MEYINTISHQVFQRDFRYVLLQHECAPHEEEHPIQHVCNTQHVSLFFAELQVQRVEEFNRMICAIFLNVNILLTAASFNIFVFISAATVISQQLEL